MATLHTLLFRSGAGLPIGAVNSKHLLSSKLSRVDFRIATITSKAMRGPPDPDKPKPFPWREKVYTNFRAYFDNTLKRLDENSKMIVVEGPPACGKTELAQALAKELDFEYFPMATLDLLYISPYGYDMRQLDPQLPRSMQSYDEKRFIREPNHVNATGFQMQCYYLKFSHYVDACAHILSTGQGVVTERSPFSDFVFAEAMRKCGYINKRELQVIHTMRRKSIKFLQKPHLIIYLDCPVPVVEENLKKRGEGEEKTLTTEFLETMEEVYKLQHLKEIQEHSELLIYDWSQKGDPECVVEDIERIDLDCYYDNDPKMRDWRYMTVDDANLARYEFTTMKNRLMLRPIAAVNDISDVPSIVVNHDDKLIWMKVWKSAPGMEYEYGFNKSMGDKILFKGRLMPEIAGKTNLGV